MDQVWEQVQGTLRRALGPQNFEIWIRPIRVGAVSEGSVRLHVPNRYYRDWVQANYGSTVTDAFGAALGRGVQVLFEVAAEVAAESPPPASRPEPTVSARDIDEQEFPAEPPPAPPAAPELRPGPNPDAGPRDRAGDNGTIGVSQDKVFDNFVVGACNQFAHAAALAVADAPGVAQTNPLFIYGGTGLGKTHLLHSIGNGVRRHTPDACILYVTAEQFTNELIDALRYRRMPSFREKYRRWPGVLLMDDVQFLTGKDRTQEELFHTFEWLKERGRQIVFTADVLPREIRGFEPRLRTRCESGLLADMQPPDLETMTAILHQKAADLGLAVPPALAQYMASRTRGSVREIEGVLNRLGMLCQLHRQPPTVEFARQHLSTVLADEPRTVDAREILQAVADCYSVGTDELLGKRRIKQLVRPRHVAMYLAREHTDLSFPDLGRAFQRDHATIQHAVKKIRGMLDDDPDLRSTIEAILRSLEL